MQDEDYLSSEELRDFIDRHKGKSVFLTNRQGERILAPWLRELRSRQALFVAEKILDRPIPIGKWRTYWRRKNFSGRGKTRSKQPKQKKEMDQPSVPSQQPLLSEDRLQQVVTEHGTSRIFFTNREGTQLLVKWLLNYPVAQAHQAAQEILGRKLDEDNFHGLWNRTRSYYAKKETKNKKKRKRRRSRSVRAYRGGRADGN